MTVFMFGCTIEWVHYYNVYLYVFIWIMNGFLQSTGWPTVVAIMANWFGHSSRGLVLGVWSSCSSVGNIIGAFMVASVLDYGYDYAFLFTASVLFAGGIINMFGLVTTPHEVGLLTPEEVSLQVNSCEEEGPLLSSHVVHNESDGVEITGAIRPKAIGFCQALLLPGVILWNFVCIAGGTIGGFLSDRLEKRAVIVIPMLVFAVPALFGYAHSPATLLDNSVILAVTGFFIGGVSNIISAAIAADLGRQGPMQGNSGALATVTGIIDGTGSVGAAIGQILVPFIQQRLGWQAVFILFMIAICLTAVCIFPMFVREVKSLCASVSFSWHRGLHRRTVVYIEPPEPNTHSDSE
ncbi:sugar phosphate exchanger 3-like [Gigantopelta aegis]|uniref:sugar phosphate exchanger 3-like n=1 Tax=Gigantopelta aegis TaxID=1735272 RepID=UPI001B88B800|nr:sugar phosphate exchanger 3-like [Gigantopelta aegis]